MRSLTLDLTLTPNQAWFRSDIPFLILCKAGIQSLFDVEIDTNEISITASLKRPKKKAKRVNVSFDGLDMWVTTSNQTHPVDGENGIPNRLGLEEGGKAKVFWLRLIQHKNK